MACKAHKEKPVRGYSECAGCEIEYWRDRCQAVERRMDDLEAEIRRLKGLKRL